MPLTTADVRRKARVALILRAQARSNPRPGRQVISEAGIREYGLPIGADIVPGTRRLTDKQRAEFASLTGEQLSRYFAARQGGKATHAAAYRQVKGTPARKSTSRVARPAKKSQPAKPAPADVVSETVAAVAATELPGEKRRILFPLTRDQLLEVADRMGVRVRKSDSKSQLRTAIAGGTVYRPPRERPRVAEASPTPKQTASQRIQAEVRAVADSVGLDLGFYHSPRVDNPVYDLALVSNRSDVAVGSSAAADMIEHALDGEQILTYEQRVEHPDLARIAERVQATLPALTLADRQRWRSFAAALRGESPTADESPITAEDRRRIQIAVEEQAARWYGNAFTGGGKDNAIRYVSESINNRFGGSVPGGARYDLADIRAAVAAEIERRPEVLTLSETERGRASAARVERVAELDRQSLAAFQRGAHAEALRLIGEGEEIDPDARDWSGVRAYILENMSLAQLEALARARGLSTLGTRDELIARLRG